MSANSKPFSLEISQSKSIVRLQSDTESPTALGTPANSDGKLSFGAPKQAIGIFGRGSYKTFTSHHIRLAPHLASDNKWFVYEILNGCCERDVPSYRASEKTVVTSGAYTGWQWSSLRH